MPHPALALVLAKLVDIDECAPFGGARQIALERRGAPQPARIVRVAPQIGDLIAHDRIGHGDLPRIVEDLPGPGLGQRIFGLRGQHRLGIGIPLVDLGQRALALDFLEPDIRILRIALLRRDRCGGENERGGQRQTCDHQFSP